MIFPTSMSNMSEVNEARVGEPALLHPDLAFIPLEDELVVFSESAQKLIGLNKTAAFLARRMERGASAAMLADMLVQELGVPAGEAGGWVRTTLAALKSHGLLDDGTVPLASGPSAVEKAMAHMRAMVPPVMEPFEPQAEGRYRLLDTLALVRCSHRAQLSLIDAVIGHLKSEETAEPNFIIDVQGKLWGDRQLCSNIYSDGDPQAQAIKLSKLGPLVKTTLWVKAVNSYDYLMNLHAGVVGRDGRCILLPAEAGSGKSSLTAALMHSGLGYYSDEVALIEPDSFQVPPVPLAICVKSTGWNVMLGMFPELTSLRTHIRDDDKTVRYCAPPSGSVQKQPAKVSHIFFPRYAKDSVTALTPLRHSEAVTRLLGQCQAAPRRLSRDDVRDIVRWISTIDCYALSFSSLEEAVQLVRRTAFA